MLKFSRRQSRKRFKASNLPERVYSGIRATRSSELHIFLRQFAEYADDFALNRGPVGLKLPAVKIGSVVRNRELEIAHAWEGFADLAFGVRRHAERTKRLPGFTAALPSRHKGQSSGS